MSRGRPEAQADRILAVIDHADDAAYFGEPVSQRDHALQAAAQARAAGAPEAEVLAALLHDIGHRCAAADAPRMAGLGVAAHEDVGADFLLAAGVGEDIATLVRGHVRAKRFLVATRPAYAARLSDASRRTLTLQGGPLSPDACRAFERDPRAAAILRVRAWDEQAKLPGARVSGLAAYRPLLVRHLTARP